MTSEERLVEGVRRLAAQMEGWSDESFSWPLALKKLNFLLWEYDSYRGLDRRGCACIRHVPANSVSQTAGQYTDPRIAQGKDFKGKRHKASKSRVAKVVFREKA